MTNETQSTRAGDGNLLALTDEQIEAAVTAWFKEKIQPGRYPFAKRMRAAIGAAMGAAAPAVPATAQPKAVQAFLCRAWGESDFPAAELVPDWDGVRAFMVREWLGDADHTDYDGTVTLDALKTDFEEHEKDQRGGPFEYEFEIGGVSIERVFGFAFQAPGATQEVQP